MTTIPAYPLAWPSGWKRIAASDRVRARFVDKKRLMIILMSLTTLLSCGFFFVPSDQVALMYVLQVAMGFVLGPKSPLAFSMYADTADYNEWRTGRRATCGQRGSRLGRQAWRQEGRGQAGARRHRGPAAAHRGAAGGRRGVIRGGVVGG